MQKPPTIRIAYLDDLSILTKEERTALSECLLGDAENCKVILEYADRKRVMVPEEVLKTLMVAAQDVVKCHTKGQDKVQDKFMERLANLIGE